MKKIKIELKWAIIFTLTTLLWMLFEKSMGWHDEHIDKHATYTNFWGIIAILLYVFALLDKRKNYYDGTMTWKKGFISGVILSIFIAVLAPLGLYITHRFITPDYFDNAVAFAVQSGNSTIEEAESYFNFTSYLIQSVLFSAIIGIITGAIVAFFVKKRGPVNYN